MAHPDASTTNGYTPLHISAREGQLDVASVLLEAGASHSLPTKVRDEQCATQAWNALSLHHYTTFNLLLPSPSLLEKRCVCVCVGWRGDGG